MKKKMRSLLGICLIIVIAIVIAYAQRRTSISKVNTKDEVIEHLISVEKVEQELNKELLEEAVSKIEVTNIKCQDAFVLGYAKYVEGDFKQAKQYFKMAYDGNDSRIRLYADLILSRILIQEDKIDEAVEVVSESLKALEAQIYNEEIELIGTLIQQVGTRANEFELLIASVEEVLETRSNLSIDAICNLKDLVGFLYYYNGNYAKAMEKFLMVITHAETIPNKIYGVKAQIDLGIIYMTLGNYEQAAHNFKQVLKVELPDKEQQALMQAYAVLNLYENMLYTDDYEDVQEIYHQVLESISYLSRSSYGNTIRIMNELYLANYYINEEKLEEAKQAVQQVESYLKQDYVKYNDLIYYNYELVKAKLAELNGELEEAIDTYKAVYQGESRQLRKYTLKRLVNALDKAKRYEEANQYEAEIINYYNAASEALSTDYMDYALYKYEHKNKLIEEADKKLHRYILATISILLTIGAIGVFYLKNRSLVQASKLDGLAKTYNRRYFEEYYNALKSKEVPFAIIIFDIDHFKAINDIYGHLVGDRAIKQVGELSKTVIKKQGKVFRYGGEEFVGIIENCVIDEVLEIAESIRTVVETYEWEEGMKVTVSLGVSQTTNGMRDILDLADQNLYRAKTQGRNQVVYK